MDDDFEDLVVTVRADTAAFSQDVAQMKRDFDSLYTAKPGTADWLTGRTPEATEWLQELADYINNKGREPVWATVHARFSELFPNETPKVASTVTAAVRKLCG